MKNSTFTLVAAGILLLAIGGCSSSTTETTTASTAEEVTNDNTTAPQQATVTAKIPFPKGKDGEEAMVDSVSFQAVAASADIFEIQSSVQAKAKAKNEEVKKYAEQMVTDHTKTSDELKQIADKRNFTLPNTLLARHQQMINKLTNEKDADEFDEQYMSMQVDVHKQAVDLYESAARSQTDPELKAYAERHLPHLRMHLELAKKTKDMIK